MFYVFVISFIVILPLIPFSTINNISNISNSNIFHIHVTIKIFLKIKEDCKKMLVKDIKIFLKKKKIKSDNIVVNEAF